MCVYVCMCVCACVCACVYYLRLSRRLRIVEEIINPTVRRIIDIIRDAIPLCHRGSPIYYNPPYDDASICA